MNPVATRTPAMLAALGTFRRLATGFRPLAMLVQRRHQPLISSRCCWAVWLKSTELKNTQTVTPARMRLVEMTPGSVETSPGPGTSRATLGRLESGAVADATAATAACVGVEGTCVGTGGTGVEVDVGAGD